MKPSSPTNPISEISPQERTLLLQLAYRFCWNSTDAEDALHNALLLAIEKATQLREPAKRWPWLCRVVIQQCHLLGRKQQTEKRTQRAAGFSLRESSSTKPTPELDRAELGELMKRLLVQLPRQQQAAVTLRHIEHMEYSQIARIMAISESTVRVHVCAGREALRNLIQVRHPGWQL